MRFQVQKQIFILFASDLFNEAIPDSPTEEFLTLLEAKKEHSLSMDQHGIVT